MEQCEGKIIGIKRKINANVEPTDSKELKRLVNVMGGENIMENKKNTEHKLINRRFPESINIDKQFINLVH